MTGVHRDTIMRLGVKVGQGCTALMDEKIRNLPCRRLEMDEIWGFIGKKEKHVKANNPSEVGRFGPSAPSTPRRNWFPLSGSGSVTLLRQMPSFKT